MREESQQTTDENSGKCATKKAPGHNEHGKILTEWHNSLRYANPPLMDAALSTRDTQMHSRLTNNREGQSGKIEETSGEARLRNKIIPERHAQCLIKSNPTAHTHTQLPRSNKRIGVRPKKSRDGHTSNFEMQPLPDPDPAEVTRVRLLRS